jgi:DNA polymerase III subunit gamma/tau
MNHTTLYRRWRPRRFGEIAGQEPVVTTLRRAIETGRVAHAYLFSGPRGTGKTSTAKVLAMGLNCENGPSSEPDGTCDNCRAITNNSSLDVVEMDAASNRGIDEIRDLRDRVNLAPVAGRKKVYIIDEVHMLTTEAFNALLKMLEEPPEHVIFVLATTEKHRVLPTIISRCQSFDFRRPGVDTLTDKLAEIAATEGIEVEPAALTAIARGGGGSFRDAEGLLDQLSSFAEGRITASMVRELLGSVGPEALLETTAALHERRAADALRIVDRLSNEGKDLGQLVSELLSHLRILMLLQHAPEIALSEVGADERGPLEEQAKSLPTSEVVRIIDALGDARSRIRRGGDPKLELELSLLKLARDYTEPSVEALIGRLETLELAVENSALAANSISKPLQEDAEPVGKLQSESRPQGDSAEKAAVGEGSVREEEPGEKALDLDSRWDLVMRELLERKQRASETIFKEARVAGFDGESLRLTFPAEQEHLLNLARDPRYLEPLLKVLRERFDVRASMEMAVAGSDGDPGDNEGSRAESRERPPHVQERSATGQDGADGGLAGGVGGAGAEDRIRSEEEVFRIAREWRGSRDARE